MEANREILTITKDGRSLRGLSRSCNGDCMFEVKVRGRIVYEGTSFQRASTIYEKLCRDESDFDTAPSPQGSKQAALKH